eukprot:CAMPEP_0119354880 /NCGR_PEP_ID=MMETSP1334-20130426/3855_1 /TAXON_ID=127549 /ORGANISM="Calcidiscus leptoporus, Strain RCC1130" /LENGTH=111 /DNA_ID=CAMNT_0007368575 /DNA_START=437 /DNA_END=770 /DNA_ORIENTATION=-
MGLGLGLGLGLAASTSIPDWDWDWDWDSTGIATRPGLDRDRAVCLLGGSPHPHAACPHALPHPPPRARRLLLVTAGRDRDVTGQGSMGSTASYGVERGTTLYVHSNCTPLP